MPKPRTMSDIRSLRSVHSSAVPRGQPAALLQMHRLATEKHRLEREVEMWARKKEQIERRLTEIEQQLELLRKAAAHTEETRQKASKVAWREVVLEY